MAVRALLMMLLTIALGSLVSYSLMKMVSSKTIPVDRFYTDPETGEKAIVLHKKKELRFRKSVYNREYSTPSKCLGWYASGHLVAKVRVETGATGRTYNGTYKRSYTKWVNYPASSYRIKGHKTFEYEVKKTSAEPIKVIFFEDSKRPDCGMIQRIPVFPNHLKSPVDVFTDLLGLKPVKYKLAK